MSVDASGYTCIPTGCRNFQEGNDALVSYIENNTNYRESAQINNETEIYRTCISAIVDENGKMKLTGSSW